MTKKGSRLVLFAALAAMGLGGAKGATPAPIASAGSFAHVAVKRATTKNGITYVGAAPGGDVDSRLDPVRSDAVTDLTLAGVINVVRGDLELGNTTVIQAGQMENYPSGYVTGNDMNSTLKITKDYVFFLGNAREWNPDYACIYECNQAGDGFSGLGSAFYTIGSVNYYGVVMTRQTFLNGNLFDDEIDDASDGEYARIYQFSVSSSLHNGETKDLYFNCDSAPDMDTILANISAVDLFGAECTVTCSDTERQKYKKDLIGTYTVTVTATDKYGQTATAMLNLHVMDITKPVVTFNGPLTYAYNTQVDLTTISSHFKITDNSTSHGGTFNATPTLTLDGRKLDSSKITLGVGDVHKSHVVHLEVSDAAGNKTTGDYSLMVTDGVKPVIARKDGSQADGKITIGLSRVFSLKAADFAALYTATDEVDGALSITADISAIKQHTGLYNVFISATDTSGNKQQITVPVSVDADVPPVFILSDKLVLATVDNPLSLEQLTAVVRKAMLASYNVRSISVDAGDYIGNENNPGDYTVSYNATVDDDSAATMGRIKRAYTTKQLSGTFDLRVQNAAQDPEEKENFFQMIGRVVSEFFQKIGNWFKGIFTKGKFDCWITNDEWEERFNADSSEDVQESGEVINSNSGNDETSNSIGE